ncbi:uncharacterized protein LOC108198866 [Daucus carota subsp. sativus]|nr:PREDICTED: uncharacterized protein LOC108198866 [Daucus carota subsp. sativus]
MNDEADWGHSNLMHFPAHDEASLHKAMQQCIMKVANAHQHDSAIAEPSPYIKHWAHRHQLALRNKNATTSTPNLSCKLAETEILICDGCIKPISLLDELFYECNSCNFFLHRSCSQFPEEFEHHLAGKLGREFGREDHELDGLHCKAGCGLVGNGIFMTNKTASLDICCASLPRMIKHEAHRHPLSQLKNPDDFFCKACLDQPETNEETIMYGCERCKFYFHIGCVIRPHLMNHRWDPHPLYLILSPKNVADHPHEFECELCSLQINPSSWFYHCNICDLSFHTDCIDPDDWLSNIKFGANDIYSDKHPHPHGLTFIFNKKKRNCNLCGKDARDMLALECSPCKYLVHEECFDED